mmetsp:Transcript_11554/g.21346  ORF Transcript_11554/g.21346 Transcript_11554/m.21346 type:complete len:379 (-) Transcript_11554:239-1375(-)|eukprot:CAMPEP_0201884560 /NCGR_PEP_ID=MMETSP0902-20130614/17429_1 /ASSEMBLY_ACC=CAM_ASM_000551 /TAXON_ID=420261 /ORGANISM="Thalassiosira antarctica, Strain CCMP982" /LENGTH=378 /DNA_ID=CAMNT_0048413549 /DNA_START=99 /DNA_END=1235 /DNA_ORIENTATION=+
MDVGAVVQFLRNALCTGKNFNVLGDSFLYDPKVTAQYYAFPSPLDKTTPLEILIGMTQFYACVSTTIAGYKILTSGVRKLQLITRLVNLRGTEVAKDNGDKKKKDDKKKDDDKSEAVARQLVTKSLLDESDAATRNTFVGANVLILGIAFFWLFANSFHVTETDWIGGVVALIHAVTVMEIVLLVFLYYMVKDAGAALRRSYRMNKFAAKIVGSKKLSDVDTITVEQYSWVVDGWAPFWAEGVSGSIGAEGKLLTKEEEAVASKLGSLSKNIGQDIADGIRAQARVALFEGYREYVYLILNCFAFYGYLACVLAFYYGEESSKPDYIKAMLMYMPSADADWLGNTVGDFAWTLEPIVILGSPMIISSMLPKKKKEKVA